jgi:HAD superfamily hydrolase (TIGR01509 family)
MKQNKNNIRCVIFDCDGVLIDSERLSCQALVDVFSAYGATASANDYLRYFQGGKLADILSEAKQRLNINVSLDELEPKYRQALERLYQTELKPVEGVDLVLNALSASKIDYCVVSNNPKEKIERSLARAGLLQKFRGACFSAFDANSWKPEPDLLLYALMNMGYSARECIYIDDTASGVEAGVKAGIETYHFRERERGIQSSYNQVKEISDMRQLLDYLQ